MILRNPTVAALLVAEAVSTTCSQMTGIALPWFVLVIVITQAAGIVWWSASGLAARRAAAPVDSPA